MDEPKSVTLSCKAYQRLLCFRPRASFLQEYESLILSDHRQQCLNAYYKQKSLGVLLLWPRLFTYTTRDLGGEHIATIQKYMVSLPKTFAIRRIPLFSRIFPIHPKPDDLDAAFIQLYMEQMEHPIKKAYK